MSTENVPIVTPFLRELMERKGRLPSQMALDLGVSHVTVIRWLSGADIPSPKSCLRLAQYSGVALPEILALCGHMPNTPENAGIQWPTK